MYFTTMTGLMPGHILIVDDEKDIRDLIGDVLQDEQYSVAEAATHEETMAQIRHRIPDGIILDVWLQDSDKDGIAILETVLRCYPDIPVVMISGHATIETAIQAIRIGAFDFIEKPFKEERLLHIMRRALETRQLRRDNTAMRRSAFDSNELIGDSPAMTKLRQGMERAAGAESRVMLYGQPGTGKTVVARALHGASKRSEGPFLTLNTALIDENNASCYLHGYYDKGERVRSIFEEAHGGTLFIEEICDLPVSAQGMLLRVLQDGFIDTEKGERIYFSVRVISATNRNIGLELRAGRLREDLFNRLAVAEINVPSLKERITDLETLVEYFVRRCAEENGIPPRHVTPNALAAMSVYSWPGNVRELRNVIERLLMNAPGSSTVPISSSMLPQEVLEGSRIPVAGEDDTEIMSLPLREARELFEKSYLSAQISRFNHNISKTAEFIGMERSALYRKLKMLGLYDGVQKRHREEEPA